MLNEAVILRADGSRERHTMVTGLRVARGETIGSGRPPAAGTAAGGTRSGGDRARSAQRLRHCGPGARGLRRGGITNGGAAMSENGASNGVRFETMRGPFQMYGASPWYTTIGIGTPPQPMKFALDSAPTSCGARRRSAVRPDASTMAGRSSTTAPRAASGSLTRRAQESGFRPLGRHVGGNGGRHPAHARRPIPAGAILPVGRI